MMRRRLAALFVLVALSFSFENVAIAKVNIEDQYLDQLRMERARVTIVLISGDKLEGYINSYDDTTIFVESGGYVLIYKNAISSITSSDGAFTLSE